MRFQSFFMLMTDQPFFFASGHQRVGEGSNLGVRSVSVFSFVVVMMNQHHEPRAVAPLRVSLAILLVAD